MTFLKQQMGEEELRSMLEKLDAAAGTAGGIDVFKLMELAINPETKQKEGSED